jgi:hypothetical protein
VRWLTQGLLLVVSYIDRPAFPASEAQFFLHQKLGFCCIACSDMASGYRPRSPMPSSGLA